MYASLSLFLLSQASRLASTRITLSDPREESPRLLRIHLCVASSFRGPSDVTRARPITGGNARGGAKAARVSVLKTQRAYRRALGRRISAFVARTFTAAARQRKPDKREERSRRTERPDIIHLSAGSPSIVLQLKAGLSNPLM